MTREHDARTGRPLVDGRDSIEELNDDELEVEVTIAAAEPRHRGLASRRPPARAGTPARAASAAARLSEATWPDRRSRCRRRRLARQGAGLEPEASGDGSSPARR